MLNSTVRAMPSTHFFDGCDTIPRQKHNETNASLFNVALDMERYLQRMTADVGFLLSKRQCLLVFVGRYLVRTISQWCIWCFVLAKFRALRRPTKGYASQCVVAPADSFQWLHHRGSVSANNA